ncbi:Rootletin [Plecturocebus cupreus]
MEAKRDTATSRARQLEKAVAERKPGASELRASQEKISKTKAKESKLEGDKLCLKEVLDASESRTIKLELQQPSLEGELQRSCLVLRNREARAHALQDQVDSLQRQVADSEVRAGTLQLTLERLNWVLAQKWLDAVRQALSEAQKQSSSLGEQVQTFPGEVADLELQRAEAEGQLQQFQKVLWQWQKGKAAALHTVQKLRDKQRLLQERLGSLQCALAQLEAQKWKMESSALQLKKDLMALRRTLDKVDHEDTVLLSSEKGRLDWTLTGAELKLAKAQRQIQQLEAQVMALEQSHSPVQLEVEAQQQLELQQEVEPCAVPRHRLNTP